VCDVHRTEDLDEGHSVEDLVRLGADVERMF
jgi:hypothetical protein